ncbi:hypothetical protein FOA52_003292 [Chlamydomonas sp. UWO 241]|nr:hypothetical protein FOA52_003292 [Chlamydomonas sp. UWO 241]
MASRLVWPWLLLLVAFASAQNKYTDGPLPGNWWNVADDLNEQWQAVQALMRSGLEAGNQFPSTLKPTYYAWAPCHYTDCSTRVQVPYPYCTMDCVGTDYCNYNSTGPGGMFSTACCQMDPLARTWIESAAEAGVTQAYCPPNMQESVDRFVSYCDYHPPYADAVVGGKGTDPRQSFFNCKRTSVSRYYVNHTFYNNWRLDRNGGPAGLPNKLYLAGITQSNSIFSIAINFHGDIYTPASAPSSAETWSGSPLNSLNAAPPTDRAWRFDMVPELLCLPLKELITEDVVWRKSYEVEYDYAMSDLARAEALVPTSSTCNLTGAARFLTYGCFSQANRDFWSYYAFEQYEAYFRSYVQDNAAYAYAASSFNPDIAVRQNFRKFCTFHPVMEHHASRWGPHVNSNPAFSGSPYTDPAQTLVDFPDRPFLPDTLEHLSITRSNKAYSGNMDLPAVIEGPLPWQWSNFKNLKYLNLSDATGNGKLEGGIPLQWIGVSPEYNATWITNPVKWMSTVRETLTKGSWDPNLSTMKSIRVIDVRGHPNFCRDWHRKFLFDLHNISVVLAGGAFSPEFTNPGDWSESAWKSIWKWSDPDGSSGIVEVLSDGKCCYGNGTYGETDAATRKNTAFNGNEGIYKNTTSKLGVDYGNICELLVVDVNHWSSSSRPAQPSLTCTNCLGMEAEPAIPTPDSSGSTHTPAVARTGTPLTAATVTVATVTASSAAFTLAPTLSTTFSLAPTPSATFPLALITPATVTIPTITLVAATPPTVTIPPTTTLTLAPATAVTISAATPPTVAIPPAATLTLAPATAVTISSATPPTVTIPRAAAISSATPPTITIPPTFIRTTATPPTVAVAPPCAASPGRSREQRHAASSSGVSFPIGKRNKACPKGTPLMVWGRVSGTVTLLPDNRIAAGPSEAVEIARQQANQSLLLLVVTFTQPVVDFRVASIDVEHAVIVSSKAVDGNTTFKLLATSDAGTRATFWLDRSMYHDALGRPGASDLSLDVAVPSPGGNADVDAGTAMSTTAAVVLGVSVAAGVVSAVSSPFVFKTGWMQSAFHIQVLAMTANLASQGVSDSYRDVALSFRWSVLGMKGFLPFLDGLDSGSESQAAPPSNKSAAPTSWFPVTLPSRKLVQVDGDYAYADSAALDVAIEEVRRKPDAAQDLLYTFIVAVLILAVFFIVHMTINILFRLFADRSLPPMMWFPRFEIGFTALLLVAITFYCCLLLGDPDALPGFTGSGTAIGDSTGFAVLLIMCLPVPFAVFLWWLLLGRTYHCEAREAVDDTSLKYSMHGGDSLPPLSPQDDDDNMEGPHWHTYLGPVRLADKGPQRRQTSFLQIWYGSVAAGWGQAGPPDGAGSLPRQSNAVHWKGLEGARVPAPVSPQDGNDDECIEGPHWHMRSSRASVQTLPDARPEAALSTSQPRPWAYPLGLSPWLQRAKHPIDSFDGGSDASQEIKSSPQDDAEEPNQAMHSGGAPRRMSSLLKDASPTIFSAPSAPRKTLTRLKPQLLFPGQADRESMLFGKPANQLAPLELMGAAGAKVHSRAIGEGVEDAASPRASSGLVQDGQAAGALFEGPSQAARSPRAAPHVPRPVHVAETRLATAADSSPTSLSASKNGRSRLASPSRTLSARSNGIGRSGSSPRPSLVATKEEGPTLTSNSLSATAHPSATHASAGRRSDLVLPFMPDSPAKGTSDLFLFAKPGASLQQEVSQPQARDVALYGVPWYALPLWALPSASMLDRFEFLFEDVLEGDPQRARWYYLMMPALNFTHKMLLAVLFGALGLTLMSAVQLAMIVCLQVLMILYVALVRPYPEWQLHWMEVSAHCLELGIFIVATAIMTFDRSSTPVGWAWAMLTLFGLTFLVIMLYEIYFLATMAVAAWKGMRAWWRERQERKKLAGEAAAAAAAE